MSILGVMKAFPVQFLPCSECAKLETRLGQPLHSTHLWAHGGLFTGTYLGQSPCLLEPAAEVTGGFWSLGGARAGQDTADVHAHDEPGV